MKKLMRLGLFAFVGLFVFAACEDNGSVSPFTADDEVALLDFMFLATANDSTNTGQPDRKRGWRGGKKCNITEVAVGDLPAVITDYISTNYTDAAIDRAGTLENGNFVVKITKADDTHAGLIFDANGEFVEEKTGKRGSRGTEVAIDALPATITAYITANYEGSTLKKAYTNEEGKFLVVIQKADETYVGVGFEADGTFISEMSRKGKKKKN